MTALWNMARVRVKVDKREGFVMEADPLVTKALLHRTNCSCGCGPWWLFEPDDGSRGCVIAVHEVDLMPVVDQLGALT